MRNPKVRSPSPGTTKVLRLERRRTSEESELLNDVLRKKGSLVASDCALETIALDAGGASVDALRLTVHTSANTLDVRVETAVSTHVRVRNRLAELRTLSTDVAY